MGISAEGLSIELSGPIASVTFMRPDKANYIDVKWIAPLKEFFEQVRSSRDVRCVLIKSTGKHFSAGGDLKLDAEIIAMPHDTRFGVQVDLGLQWDDMISVMLTVPQPIVASVQGGAVGGAVGLVAACDIVIAAENAFMSIAHIHCGLAVSELITYFLPRQIGYKKTMYLALLGERVSAREAERLGLFSTVVPSEQLQEETTKLVERLANGPTAAYGYIKELVLNSFDRSRQETATLEAVYVAKTSKTHDFAEGSEAVHKKRKAIFTGS
jgi:2-(1,2-epoxy-1,2-dihydrophenyl)acetyl-CoA isomerase